MNNIIVYCETDNGALCDVSLELLTKARELAGTLSCNVEALLIGHNVKSIVSFCILNAFFMPNISSNFWH